MKENFAIDAINHINNDLVEEYAKEKEHLKRKRENKKRTPWIKWASVAACFCLMIVITVVAIYQIQNRVDPNGPGIDSGSSNNDSKVGTLINQNLKGNISIDENATEILYPWQYQTATEKYSTIYVNNIRFIGYDQTAIDVSFIGGYIGTFSAQGEDLYEEKTYKTDIEVYKIKNVSSNLRVAAKIDGEYYVYGNRDSYSFETFGELLNDFGLKNYVAFSEFYSYYDEFDYDSRKLNDGIDIWQVLLECQSATPNVSNIPDGALVPTEPTLDDQQKNDSSTLNEINFEEVDHISFAITSKELGIYKKSLRISRNGYITLNIDFQSQSYYIGKEQANKIVGYVMSNSTETESEPYHYWLVGELTEIHDDYVLIDDTALCADEKDGRVYKLLLDDIRVKRCFDFAGCDIKLGDTIAVIFDEPIMAIDGNVVSGANDVQKAYINGAGDAVVPE